MTIGDLGTIANLVSAIAVLATLIYLSRQVKQGNMLALSQARQRMVEQANAELYVWMNDPGLQESFAKPTQLSREEQGKMHHFLLGAMRAREWEWFQFRDGVIKDEVYKAYHEVIAHIAMNEMRIDARRPDQTGPGIVASLVGPIAIEATAGNVYGD